MALMMQLFILVLLPAAFLLPPAARAGEIIGGWEARPYSRPYMAFLEITEGGNFSRCGGFLVSENVVLTAAHCDGSEITVVLGAHDIDKLWDWNRKTMRAVAKIPHPGYNNRTKNNDIMLLQLEKKVKLNKHIGFIPLPPAYQSVPPGTNCSVAGWGGTSANNSALLPDKLQEVDVVVMPDTDCPGLPNGPYLYYNPFTMLCVGDPQKGKNSYKGDSGGPLECGGTAQGIVSLVRSSGTPPAVYTKVSSFIPWIQQEMKKMIP